MKKLQHWLPMGVICLLFLYTPITVMADMRPPLPPSGGSIYTVEDTYVQMVAETVFLQVQEELAYDHYQDRDILQYVVRVTVDFTMQNTGPKEESMQAVFPLTSVDPSQSYPDPIDDFSVFIEGEEQLWKSITHEICPYVARSQSCQWARFQVVFPPKEMVHITISYQSYLGDVGAGLGFNYASYILTTGAAWYGPIGEADFILELPYPASKEVVLDLDYYPEEIHYPENPPIFDGNQAIWHYESLEPDRNWGVYFADPDQWMRVEEIRTLLKDDPENGALWGELGETYWEMCTLKGWMESRLLDFGYKALEAYDAATTLEPENPYFHGGYGDALYGVGLHEAYMLDSTDKLEQSLDEYKLAVEFGDGTENDLQGYWTYIQFDVENALEDYRSLPTKTPTQTPTKLPTETSTPTKKLSKTPTRQVANAPTKTKPSANTTATVSVEENTKSKSVFRPGQIVAITTAFILIAGVLLVFVRPKHKK